MLTYVVQQGDTLYAIAERFHITVKALMLANKLSSTTLYIGQKLIIPVPVPYLYTVHPGDTLYSVALKFNTTVEAIMMLNSLQSSLLYVGQKLLVPIYSEAIVNVETANVRSSANTSAPLVAQMGRGARLPITGSAGDWFRVRLYNGRAGWILRDIVSLVPHSGDKPIEEIFSYYTEEEGTALPGSQQVFTQQTALQTNVGMFYFRIHRADPTQVEKYPYFNDSYMRYVVNFGHKYNIKMLATIHNLFYVTGQETINKDVLRRMLSTIDTRRAFIHNVLRLLQTYDFDGVNIDFEEVYYEDRSLYLSFYAELAEQLRSHGYFYSVAVPARISDTSKYTAAFDYSVIGSAVDELVVMVYNEHGWPGSGPGPVVSIGWMETVIRYALTKTPGAKISAAVSVFGFDFNLTTGRNTYITYDTAIGISKKYNKTIIFDQKSQTPMFAYIDESGNGHQVWFENAASIRAKLLLARRLGIRGLSLWRLGMEDPDIWRVLTTEFVVAKSVT